jgi:anti-anti-sigma regulatory factor
MVAVIDGVVKVKVCGRATFVCGADFKALVYGLKERGSRQFLVDLTDCAILDSTFLGILAGFGLKLAETGSAGARIRLLNPNPRITDLLENLGVTHLFELAPGAAPLDAHPTETTLLEPHASKLDTSRVVLEAHETLMAINPANVPRFKDVTRFMAEDLRRQAEAGPGTGGPPAGT